MTFDEVLKQVRELLQSKSRVAYRALKRRFELDDEYLEDLKAELIDAEQVAHDEDGKVLVWTGSTTVASSQLSVPSSSQSLAPQTADSESRTPNSLSSQTPDAQREAERRQLTVMFCDLVGSTALSEQLDPEDLREVVQAYQATCTGVIRRYGGHIAQHLGDGLLVYCGYPVAHEDDAPRAVRTALGIVAAMQHLSFPTIQLPYPVQVRIGIHTGLVVIGEIGSSEKHEILALGETPNLAARIQGVAEPDTVVTSTATHRLVQGLFECQDLGPQMLKGLSIPLSVYQVIGESTAQSRFEVAVSTGLTPLVGREEELGLLQRRWTQAKEGAGQVVLLSGEPGIGKSRLVQALKDHIGQEDATRIEFRCSPYHQNSAFYPMIEHLQRFLQFQREELPQAKLAKLQHALFRSRFPQADTLPLLAALLSLPPPEDCAPLALSPQKQKQKTQEALVAWIIEEGEKAAVYCAWEDLHWADPSTLEVLTLFLEQIPTTRVFAVLTFRPDFTPPWSARSYLTPLTLSRLGRQQVETMVEQVTSGKALPAGVVQQIVSRTDGVPLFVEELTKSVLEAVAAHSSAPLQSLTIPSTLQDSLMARLDRLGPAKEVAQLGATLGREFSYELLQAVSPKEKTNLQQALAKLVEAEVLYQRGQPPHTRYLFKHALIQDVAYQSLLKSTRQQYHSQIAKVMEEQLAETKETQPELLAHHYTEASLLAQAIPYWQQAGQRAIERLAPAEAISHLTKGLDLLKALPDTPEHIQKELLLQTALGPALIATKGQAAPDVAKVYTRARALCQQLGETPQLFPVILGLRRFYLVQAELQTARQLGEQLLSLAQNEQDSSLLLEAHGALGLPLFWLGELTSARAHLEQGITLYDPQQHGSHVFLYGQDPGVLCRLYAALTLWHLGYPDQALQRVHEALTLAQDRSHPYSLAFALYIAAWVHQYRREEYAVQQRVEEMMSLCHEHGFPFWLAEGTILQGRVLIEQGKYEEGVGQIRHGVAAHRDTGVELGRPYFLAVLAEAYGKVGQEEEALAVLTEALALVKHNGERMWEAELDRLKGELILSQSSVQRQESRFQKDAEACFQQAIEIARQQQAKSLELRAAMSLSRLWRQQGKKTEAHQMLADIYNWFTEGFDSKDLQEAKALLHELV